jgi:hypothetical protein
MATLASWLDRAMGLSGRESNLPVPGGAHMREDAFTVRPLPNEDVALWIKSIDNSRVRPQRDPEVRKACVRFITMSSVSMFLAILLFLPNAYGVLAGYQLGRLQKEHTALRKERDLLRNQQAELESPKTLAKWAQEYGLKPPAPEQVVYLPPAEDESLAMNSGKR